MSEKRQDYISWDEYFALSARIIRSCPLVIMVFRGGVRTMYSHGAEKAMSWIPSIFMLLTAN